jgi:hypothetical protein
MKRGLIIVLALFFVIPAVSAGYSGGFDVDKDNFQLGEEFTITGSNINFDGEMYNGNAMVVLNNDVDSTYTLVTEVRDGSFNYVASFCDLSTCKIGSANGNFSADVTLLDFQLDELHEFSHVFEFVLIDTLDVTLGLEDSQLDPEDNLRLTGSAFRSVDSIGINEMYVTIAWDDFETEISEDDNAFEYETDLSSTVLSNYHNITVTVEDEFGNKGVESIRFYVTPIPNWMEISTNGTEFMPGSDVAITAAVYDQADRDTSNDIKFELKDPRGKKIVKETLHTNEVYNFQLEEYALPGEWKLYAKYDNLESESFFIVREIELLDVSLVDQSLVIKNIGNIYYDKNLVIIGDGKDKKTIDRRTNLKPGDEIVLELYELFDTGFYKVRVTNTGDEYELQIIDPRGLFNKMGGFFGGITGQAVGKSGTGTSNIPTIIMTMLLLAGLVIFSVRLRTRKYRFRTPGYFSEKKKKIKVPKFRRKKRGDVENLKESILKDVESSGRVDSKRSSEKKENNYMLPPGFGDIKEPKNKPGRVDFDRPLDKD